eukprot:TRINITY_DN17915_c0_g1_i1.p1 TRINITY_DN17915_c0_g1~~TRINITY_DN17915_c0_g1_i1.p1  ORF type:complete len:342 (-),score=80.77 TRINITY_DN17915_c0_g1_i1:585-1562(-)
MAFRMASAGMTLNAGARDGYSTPEFVQVDLFAKLQASIDSESEAVTPPMEVHGNACVGGLSAKTLEQKIWELQLQQSGMGTNSPFQNAAVAAAIEVPPAPHPAPRPSKQQDLGQKSFDDANPKSSRFLARLAASGQVASVGSMNHPHACGGACKYVKRKGGCKEGSACPKCHLCFWVKASTKAEKIKAQDNQHEEEKVTDESKLQAEAPNLSISATTAYPTPANFQSKLALSDLKPATARISTSAPPGLECIVPEPIQHQPQMPQMVSSDWLFDRSVACRMNSDMLDMNFLNTSGMQGCSQNMNVGARAFMAAVEPEDSIVWVSL